MIHHYFTTNLFGTLSVTFVVLTKHLESLFPNMPDIQNVFFKMISNSLDFDMQVVHLEHGDNVSKP